MEMKIPHLEKTAPLFAALGDPVRLGMVSRLCKEGPLTTIRLKEETNVSRQAVTKHLRLLEVAGLVRSQRAGKERLWRMENKRLTHLRHQLDLISRQWDATLERLRSFVEEETS